MDRVHFQHPGVVETPDFVSQYSAQMSQDLVSQTEEFIRDQMELRGITEADLHGFVLEYHPISFEYDPKMSRLKATQSVRLRHLTDEELAERENEVNGLDG